ncbi:MAG: DUF3303 domain-containing protein [Candidatus Thorarchaeota archaeon]
MFITYWELNPDFDPGDLAEIAQELMGKKLYPTEGVKQLAFYVSSTDYWGIGVDEADSEEALSRNVNMWRIAKSGFIRSIKTTPAIEVGKILPVLVKLKKQIKG